MNGTKHVTEAAGLQSCQLSAYSYQPDKHGWLMAGLDSAGIECHEMFG
jgi:hypothetical protein